MTLLDVEVLVLLDWLLTLDCDEAVEVLDELLVCELDEREDVDPLLPLPAAALDEGLMALPFPVHADVASATIAKQIYPAQ